MGDGDGYWREALNCLALAIREGAQLVLVEPRAWMWV